MFYSTNYQILYTFQQKIRDGLVLLELSGSFAAEIKSKQLIQLNSLCIIFMVNLIK